MYRERWQTSADLDLVLFRITVRGVSRNQMTYPTEQTTGANPDSRSNYQPEEAAKDLAVVDLPNPGDEEAQNRRDAWISHYASA
jgi:hypothetical protein